MAVVTFSKQSIRANESAGAQGLLNVYILSEFSVFYQTIRLH